MISQPANPLSVHLTHHQRYQSIHGGHIIFLSTSTALEQACNDVNNSDRLGTARNSWAGKSKGQNDRGDQIEMKTAKWLKVEMSSDMPKTFLLSQFEPLTLPALTHLVNHNCSVPSLENSSYQLGKANAYLRLFHYAILWGRCWHLTDDYNTEHKYFLLFLTLILQSIIDKITGVHHKKDISKSLKRQVIAYKLSLIYIVRKFGFF